jgi:hypothetical protein
MISRRVMLSSTTAVLAGVAAPAVAQMMNAAELSPHADAQEKKFISEASRFLHAHYPTPAQAARAGFIQFTPEDRTGAISWANRQWNSADARHPSQVWYDVHGRLIGADYSLLQSDHPDRPHVWGIDPRRWITIHQHVHFGLRTPDGVKFGATSAKRFQDAGGSLAAPSKQTLVNMGLAKSAGDVAFVFVFPTIWDLQFWVIPNPNGAFAAYNPNVKPENAQAHPM